MTTINDLVVSNSFSPDDKLPMWSNTNGVTRGLPFSVLTASFLTQDDIALIAASSSVETFTAGVDFTPGVSLTLNLIHNYGSDHNIEVHFDAAYQGPDQFSLVVQTLTFTSPIPLGTNKVYVSGGAVRLIGTPSDSTVNTSTIVDGAVTTSKLALGAVIDASIAAGTKLFNRINDLVDVKDFGAKGDGVTNDTNAVLAAIGAGVDIMFPAGTYVLDPFTIPSGIKSVSSRAGAILKPSGNVPVGAGFSTWITALNLSDSEITGLSFQAPSVTYSGLTVLLASGCTNTRLRNLTLNGAGYTGISMALGVNNKVVGCNVKDYKGNGIQVSGGSLAALDLGTEVASCYTEGNGVASVAHGVSVIYAIDFNIHHNKSLSAGTFGFGSAFCEGGIFAENISYNSIHEGLNVEDGNHIKTIGNTARWDAGGGPGTDFGMSFFGNTRNCVGLEVIGNKVINSASSGIAFAGSASFGVQHSPVRDNFVFNCNAKQAGVAGGVDNLAGIMLSASLTQANPIAGNTVVDTVGTLTYGIAELNFGTGFPSSNEITSNRTFGTFAGGAAIHANNASTKTALNTPQL